MNQKINELEINGVVYVPKTEATKQADTFEGMDYCIVRTYSAGVFAAYVEKREGKEATLRKARRLWYWDGASSLSQLAVDGTTKPQNCKFPAEVDKIEVTEVIEISYCTEKAKQSIAEVKVWQQN